MKNLPWFTLVLKAIGVLLIAMALRGLLPHAMNYHRAAQNERMVYREGLAFGRSTVKQEYLLRAMPEATRLALGLYLVFGGRLLVNFCIPPNRRYCSDCGSEVSGGETAMCADCGATLPTPARPAARAERSG